VRAIAGVVILQRQVHDANSCTVICKFAVKFCAYVPVYSDLLYPA